jgi:plasmid maintenance system antidote protein VapI
MYVTDQEPIDQSDAAATDGSGELKALCDNGFDGDIGAAALALGRDEEQITDILDGNVQIDEDLIMKIHGIADERAIDLG